MKVTVILTVINAFWTVHKGFDTRIGKVWNRRTSRDHSNYSIDKISQNAGVKNTHGVIKYQTLPESKKAIEDEGDGDTINAFWTVHKGLIRGLEKFEIGGQAETIQTIALIRSAKILRRDLRRLVVTQTPVKDHQLTLVWKTRKE